MNTSTNAPVNYSEAARRHLRDAEILFDMSRHANAGQLFGFAAECGLKAMLLACKVPAGPDGGLPEPQRTRHSFRKHMPELLDSIAKYGHLIPDGASATRYMALLPRLINFENWSIDHRYWRATDLPLTSVADWRDAAIEVGTMLDLAKQDGMVS